MSPTTPEGRAPTSDAFTQRSSSGNQQETLPVRPPQPVGRVWRMVRVDFAPRRRQPSAVSLGGRRLDQYAAATINHRLIAISGMFAFRGMRDPDAPSPVPKGREASRASTGERNGLLAHVARRPKTRSALRLREPRRLPRAPDLREAAELLASFHAWRDRAIAGLMLYCGLRSAEVLGMNVTPWLVGPGLVTLSGR
jgi:integrase/recombinase XerD